MLILTWKQNALVSLIKVMAKRFSTKAVVEKMLFNGDFLDWKVYVFCQFLCIITQMWLDGFWQHEAKGSRYCYVLPNVYLSYVIKTCSKEPFPLIHVLKLIWRRMQKEGVIIQGEVFFLSDKKKDEASSQVSSLRRGADLRTDEEADIFP